jgi:hypothetical protein
MFCIQGFLHSKAKPSEFGCSGAIDKALRIDRKPEFGFFQNVHNDLNSWCLRNVSVSQSTPCIVLEDCSIQFCISLGLRFLPSKKYFAVDSASRSKVFALPYMQGRADPPTVY